MLEGTEVLQVSPDLIGKWEVVVTLRPRDGGPPRQRTLAAQVVTANDAAGLAEAFIMAERRSVTKLKGREAPWRAKPASDKQLAILTCNKVPHKKPISMGEASDLIDLVMTRRAR